MTTVAMMALKQRQSALALAKKEEDTSSETDASLSFASGSDSEEEYTGRAAEKMGLEREEEEEKALASQSLEAAVYATARQQTVDDAVQEEVVSMQYEVKPTRSGRQQFAEADSSSPSQNEGASRFRREILPSTLDEEGLAIEETIVDSVLQESLQAAATTMAHPASRVAGPDRKAISAHQLLVVGDSPETEVSRPSQSATTTVSSGELTMLQLGERSNVARLDLPPTPSMPVVPPVIAAAKTDVALVIQLESSTSFEETDFGTVVEHPFQLMSSAHGAGHSSHKVAMTTTVEEDDAAVVAEDLTKHVMVELKALEGGAKCQGESDSGAMHPPCQTANVADAVSHDHSTAPTPPARAAEAVVMPQQSTACTASIAAEASSQPPPNERNFPSGLPVIPATLVSAVVNAGHAATTPVLTVGASSGYVGRRQNPGQALLETFDDTELAFGSDTLDVPCHGDQPVSYHSPSATKRTSATGEDGGLAAAFGAAQQRAVQETQSLRDAQRRLAAATGNVTPSMVADVQRLLQLFGLPYMVAPQEAEAQCVKLELARLSQGTITDDSDAFLFGSKRVYRGLFSRSKTASLITAEDVAALLGLDRWANCPILAVEDHQMQWAIPACTTGA